MSSHSPCKVSTFPPPDSLLSAATYSPAATSARFYQPGFAQQQCWPKKKKKREFQKTNALVAIIVEEQKAEARQTEIKKNNELTN